MKSKFVLDTLPAAHALAVDVLKKADRVFYRQRRIMEDSYGYYQGDPTRQEQLFRDLVALLRKAILPPP